MKNEMRYRVINKSLFLLENAKVSDYLFNVISSAWEAFKKLDASLERSSNGANEVTTGISVINTTSKEHEKMYQEKYVNPEN